MPLEIEKFGRKFSSQINVRVGNSVKTNTVSLHLSLPTIAKVFKSSVIFRFYCLLALVVCSFVGFVLKWHAFFFHFFPDEHLQRFGITLNNRATRCYMISYNFS